MSKRLFATALLAVVVAACGGDGRITEPRSPGKMTVLAAIGTDPATGATIETDLDDYAPGGVVTLTGRGWAPNETVRLVMTEDPDRHADVVRDVQADGAGAFTLRFYDVQESDIGVRFTLTGTGTTSGSKVTVQFTDQRNLTAIVLSPASPFAPATSVTAQVEVVLNSGGGGPSTWLGTKWEIRNAANVVVASSPAPCINTPDHEAGDADASGNKHYESFSFTAPAAGTYNLTVSVFSTDNCALASDATSLTVPFTVSSSNTAPTVAAGADATINEGGTFTGSGSFTDPDANSWTATVDYGDGSGSQPLTLTLPAKTFSLSHQYADNGTYNVTVTVNDGTANGSDVVAVTVNNVAPVVNAGPDATIAAGGTFTQSGSFTDPGADTWTATVDYGDGSGVQPLTLSGKNFSLSHTYAAGGSFTVSVTVTDDDGGTHTDQVVVNVSNNAPVVSAGNDATINEGATFTRNGSFTDPDADTWTATVDYGDGSGVQPLTLTGKNFSLSHTYADNGTFTVKVTVTDNQNGSGSDEVEVKVNNVAPTIGTKTAGGNVNEGSSISFAVSNVTDPSTVDVAAGFSYAFSCNGSPFSAYGPSSTTSCPAGDGPGSVTITAKAKDKDGGESAEVSSTFTVLNIAPTVDAGAATASLDEGSTFSRSGSFADPGPDTWSATVDYGDGSGVQPLTLALDKSFSLSHTYQNDGVFTVTVTVTDDEGAAGADQITVTASNVLPVVNAGAGGTINEGGTFTGSGSFTDPGADTWTATVDYGDGTGTQPLTLTGKNFSLSHTYTDDTGGPFTVTVTVNDDDGFGSGTTSVTVLNVVPNITSLNVPLSPVSAGPSNVTVTWQFTDPGADQWTCEISWDTGLAFEAATYAPTKSCTATKSLSAGIYTVTVKVSDDDGGSDTETATTYIVVYDPSAGFVTGGGWINSPAGAYVPDPTLSGKANFGFVSKYKKGMAVPEGNTEFQFHAGNLNFKSTAYDWLVVASYKAQFKGVGTINGSGTYYFMLSAIDGQINGGGGTDKFRMKIWKIVNGSDVVVYDNQMNAAVDADPTTTLGGGSINIQAK